MAINAGRRGRPRFTVLVMVLASITVLTLDAKDVPVLGSIRSGALDVLAPVGSAFTTVTKPFRNAWKGVSDYDDLEDENAHLQAEIDRMRGQSERNAGLEEEVRKLEEQVGVRQNLPIPAVTARVATGNFTSFDDNTAQIDQGTNAGIAVGNPVVTEGGLVGRVTKVTRSQSDQTQILEVERSADLSRLDYVQVLNWVPQP